MKKIMMMAMMVVASATAFAGDSDAFKALKKNLKGLAYAEAEAQVKNSIDQLANAQEKAAAYNMLVDLASRAPLRPRTSSLSRWDRPRSPSTRN